VVPILLSKIHVGVDSHSIATPQAGGHTALAMSFRFFLVAGSALVLTWMVALAAADAQAHTFYVDATVGDDGQDGLKPEAAWRSLARVNHASLAPGDRVLFRRGQAWRGQLVPHSGDASGAITYGAFGDGAIPILLGSVAADRVEDWRPAGQNIWTTSNEAVALPVDVGNIIFDHGPITGVKQWNEADLRREGDYFYDPGSRQVKLRSNSNPATRHGSIELALRRHIIDQSGRSYVTYEDLDLRYGAAHGIGGSGVHHVTIRGCDISFIGGGHQMTRPNGKPVRYGNGIEFWSSAHDCLVENCRLWEIYDAALTNQGDGTNVQENITYRNNVIWSSEYSFEYWNRGPASLTRNIVFEHNTCVDAGDGWGHGQRPDPNGRHLMFWDNSARTTNVVVRDNIFCRAADSLLRLHGRDWTAALVMERNCWFQPLGPVLLWGQQTVGREEFAAFLRSHGLDRGSLFADPKFVDAAGHNYRLAPDSPARALEGQNQPAGASPETAVGAGASAHRDGTEVRGPKPPSPRHVGSEREYLGAVLPKELIRYAGIEVPSRENIHVLSDGTGRYLEFRLVPGQAKKNNGIRAEISVDYPYSAGDIVRYRWEMRLPGDFKADEPRNRWWVMGQWHDQPDLTKGETWQGFPGRSPPVSFNYGRRDGKDFLSLLVGSPKMKSVGLLPIIRDTWHVLDVVIKWSQGDDGRVEVFFDGSRTPAVTGIGPNMHNGFQHYLKLGMYRHPEIATENRLDIRHVFIEKLKDWPEIAPR